MKTLIYTMESTLVGRTLETECKLSKTGDLVMNHLNWNQICLGRTKTMIWKAALHSIMRMGAFRDAGAIWPITVMPFVYNERFETFLRYCKGNIVHCDPQFLRLEIITYVYIKDL